MYPLHQPVNGFHEVLRLLIGKNSRFITSCNYRVPGERRWPRRAAFLSMTPAFQGPRPPVETSRATSVTQDWSECPGQPVSGEAWHRASLARVVAHKGQGLGPFLQDGKAGEALGPSAYGIISHFSLCWYHFSPFPSSPPPMPYSSSGFCLESPLETSPVFP